MPIPRRAYEIEIKVQGDTWQDAIHEMQRMAEHIDEHGPGCDSVGGGVHCGHIVTIRHNPDMTHEKYIEAVHRYRGSLTPAPRGRDEVG